MRLVPALLLLLSAPLGAQPPPPIEDAPPEIPQPVVLDWGEDFRLYAPPRNVGTDGLKKAAAEESRQRIPPQAVPSRAPAVLGPEDPARDRYSTRRIETGDDRLNLKAPVSAGPVSLGASYGKYRAVPNIPTREVSADDMRVSLGIAF